MTSIHLTKVMLDVLPLWHYKLVRPLKQYLKNQQISLEAYYCLFTLHQQGPMSMRELAEQLKISKQQMTQLIDVLFAGDLLTRETDPSDRRLIQIGITERGETYLIQLFSQDAAFFQSLGARLTSDELGELSASLETLRRLLPKLN